jgi:mRNA interferase YafQ
MTFIRRPSTKFKKDLKRVAKRGYALKKLELAITMLANNEPLPIRYRNHKLSGNYSGHWECHIEPDWLLIYYYEGSYLNLMRTGTHADLFE